MTDRLTLRDLIAPASPRFPQRTTTYTVGLDLGQAADYSALCIVETTLVTTASPSSADREQIRTHQLRYLHRYPLRTGYPEIVDAVADLVHQPPLTEPGTTLLVDKTGVGAAVVDLLRAKRLPVRLRAVTITAGSTVTADGVNINIPKRDLVSAVLVLLQNGDLQIAADLPLAETLRTELKGFRVKISASGHDSYAAGDDWRSAPHDDLVLAVALACWQAAKPPLRIGLW